jgi:VCBS repeat-containing protein
VQIVSLPEAGVLSLGDVPVGAGQFVAAADIAAGGLTFTPAAGGSGAGYAHFSFIVYDDGGGENGGTNADPAQHTLTFDLPANTAPADHGANVLPWSQEDKLYLIDKAALLAGFTDAEGDALTLKDVAVSIGTLADNGDGTLTFTPPLDFHGELNLFFNVDDGQGGVTPASRIIYLAGANDAPQGQNQHLALAKGQTVLTLAVADFGFSDAHDSPANNLSAVLINTVPQAGALTLAGTLVTAGQWIAAADIAAGLLQFAPDADARGASHAQLSFQVRDDGDDSDGGENTDATPRTLTFDLPANTAPVDQGENVLPWAQEDRLYLIDKAALLAGFTDAEGDALTLKDVTVSLGTLADNGDGTLSFTPPADFNGELDLSFNVDDGHGGVTPASRTLYLVAVNDAPQGQDHTLSLLQRGSVSLTLADFGFSDTHDNPANGLIAVQIVSVPEAGVLTLGDVTVGAGQFVAAADIAAGVLKFTPAASGSGTGYAHFSFIVYDDGSGDNGGTNADPTPRVMTFDVQAVNTAPVDLGSDILPWGTEDTPITLSKADLLADFVDADGDAMTLTDLRVTLGTLVDNGKGTLTFTPPADFNGELHLIFNVDDGHSGVTESSRIIYLTSTNDAAVIGSADVKVDESNAPIAVGGTLSITDIDSPASFQAQPGTAGKYGVFTLGGDGAWTYKANLAYDYLNPGETLKDVFQVYAADGTAASVTVTINGTADTTTVHLGDAPVRQSGTGGQWAQAWTQTGYSIQHKADITNSGEAWSAVTLNSVSAQQLGGGDVSAGNVGVSGQSAATSTVKQEIDGKEALRIVTPTSADSVTVKLAGLYAHDDGSTMNESGLLRLLDAGGHVVAEQLFVADSRDGSKTITLTAPGGFQSMELVAGAYDTTGHFVYGAYSNDQGAYGAPVSTDVAGNKHGSDFLLHSVDFTVALVGSPVTPN